MSEISTRHQTGAPQNLEQRFAARAAQGMQIFRPQLSEFRAHRFHKNTYKMLNLGLTLLYNLNR